MKKFIAILMIAVLALTCITAFAATYIDRDRDLTFEYDEALFEISMDDQTDDELLVILTGKQSDWGDTYIKFYLADLEDGEKFPTLDDFNDMVAEANVEVTQGEWNGFTDVIMYTFPGEGESESVFIVPIYDDDGDKEVEDVLTVTVGVTDMEDSMARDDAISAVLDSMKVLDD